MEFTYETQGANSFLVYAIDEKEEIDTLSLGMITNNKISGFLPAVFTQVNDIRYVKYNISAKISADQIFAGTVMKKQLLGIFLGISEAMLAAEDYMIPLNSLVLDLKYIYVDVSTYKAKLVCVPLAKTIEQDSLNLFLKKIMFNTRFDAGENTNYVARIISKLNASSSMSMNEFKEMIALLKNELSMDEQMGMLSQELGAWEYEKVFRDKIDNDNLKENQDNFIEQNQVINGKNIQSMQGVSNGQMQNVQGMQSVANGQEMQDIQNIQGQQGLANGQGMQNIPNGQGMQDIQNIQGQQGIPNRQEVQDNKKLKKEKIKKIKDKTTVSQTQIPGQNNRMNIPGQNGKINNGNSNANAVQSSATDEEKISLGHLLMHFNSENMAKYKAQKAENKHQKKIQNTNMNNMGNVNTVGNVNNMVNMNTVGSVNSMGSINNVGSVNSMGSMNNIGNINTMGMQNMQGIKPQMDNGGQNSNLMGKAQNSNFGETIVLNAASIGETVVLNSILQNNSNMPYLVRKKTGERVNITKSVFHIGKERSFADYFIADNSAISRSHANILLKNGRCFVVDTNSTNHTYIDGKMIPCNIEIELYSNNILKLANEEFEVHLM